MFVCLVWKWYTDNVAESGHGMHAQCQSFAKSSEERS